MPELRRWWPLLAVVVLLVAAGATTSMTRLPLSRVSVGAGPDGVMKVSAAWLIERVGFAKGYRLGGAAISSKHTLALTNPGGGSTKDLLALAAEIRDGVFERFAVTLHAEPVLVNCTL